MRWAILALIFCGVATAHGGPLSAGGRRGGPGLPVGRAPPNRRLVKHRPPGTPGCRDQLAADRPGLIRGQEYRDERESAFTRSDL